eukprot:TRINITY_DN12037_c0_g1_i1.p1 TRINITY_DN12037_c0_g1~~TRINITY_DN12037_c0_g1_i1.p1  ORF type:complete len:141 (-),score=39.88 TRINITY_DN12037_c0_g1_i1:243-665(-)
MCIRYRYRTALTAFYQHFKPSLDFIVGSMMAEAQTQDPGQATPPAVIVVSDLRHPMELTMLERHPGTSRVLTMRVEASDRTRAMRGWRYDPKKDNDVTEKKFDGYQGFDLVCDNNPGADGKLQRYFNSEVLGVMIQHARF